MHAQAEIPNLTLNNCHKYWIAGLRENLKREVRIHRPDTMDKVIVIAINIEIVDMKSENEKLKTEAGRRPAPKQKQPSADVAAADYVADEATGLSANCRRTNSLKASNTKNTDEDFTEFH